MKALAQYQAELSDDQRRQSAAEAAEDREPMPDMATADADTCIAYANRYAHTHFNSLAEQDGCEIGLLQGFLIAAAAYRDAYRELIEQIQRGDV